MNRSYFLDVRSASWLEALARSLLFLSEAFDCVSTILNTIRHLRTGTTSYITNDNVDAAASKQMQPDVKWLGRKYVGHGSKSGCTWTGAARAWQGSSFSALHVDSQIAHELGQPIRLTAIFFSTLNHLRSTKRRAGRSLRLQARIPRRLIVSSGAVIE